MLEWSRSLAMVLDAPVLEWEQKLVSVQVVLE